MTHVASCASKWNTSILYQMNKKSLLVINEISEYHKEYL